MTKLRDAIAFLDQSVPNPHVGLPDEVFYYVSKTTPFMNVDLLIKDERGRVLLSWRDDDYTETGWHVPGGIIRFKETMEQRIQKVAQREIGIDVDYDVAPLAVNEMIQYQQVYRSHFISLLIGCRVPPGFMPDNGTLNPTDAGYLQWHQGCPDDLIPCHRVYAPFL